MNLQSTDFELFAVPARFAQDAAQLDARWKELQRQVHPDRFAAEGAAAQRVPRSGRRVSTRPTGG